MGTEFWLLLAFIVKHFVCDYPLQAFPWMYHNKGTYAHPGGIVHAWIHGLATQGIVMFVAGPSVSFWCATADFLVHYHVDWAKMNIAKRYNWKPDNSEMFWQLLGLDQLLHYLTYFAIVGVLS